VKTPVLATAGLALTLAACGGQAAPPEQSPRPAGPQEVAVTAVDYVFEGVPAALEAGETTFVLTNEGEVRHEMGFGRLIGDKNIEQILRLPEEDLEGEIEQVQGILPIAPGEAGEVTLQLEPGRYAYVCFVGQGLGRPHVTEGMLGEFTVE
jgi:uncharacterized cupredoxin-like copper-binding protein